MTIRRGEDKSNLTGAALGGGLGAVAGGPVGAAIGGAVGSRLGDETRGERPEDDPKAKPNPGGEEEPKDGEGDEDTDGDAKKADDLKPGERGMIDAHQAIRDHRMENARKWHATDDPEAEAAHEAIDDHLAKAEEIAGDYMESRGHKRPEAIDFEKCKSMCKADGGMLETAQNLQDKLEPLSPQKKVHEIMDGAAKAATVRYPGIAYRGRGLAPVSKAAQAADAPKLAPHEARIVERELGRLRKRLGII